MKFMNNGFVICPKEWIFDETITSELGLLLIISSLCNKSGYCYASNKYFSKIFKVSEQTISKKLSNLKAKKYIKIEYEKRGCKVDFRRIRLTKRLTHGYQKQEPSVNQNFQENNISSYNNIKHINDIDMYCRATLDHTSLFSEIISCFNKIGIKESVFKNKKEFHFKNTKTNQQLIENILNQGYTKEDIFDVIFLKYDQWIENNNKNKTDMSTFYRPSTVLGKKFDEYLQEAKMKGVS